MSASKPPFAPEFVGNQGGFTLLEGLVAIALLAGTLVAIFSLVASILASAVRVGRSNDTAQMTLNALEVMRTVNPMTQPKGQIDLGPYAVDWQSTALVKPVDGTGYPAGVSLYVIGFYKTEVTVTGAHGAIFTHFGLRQIGYKRVRDVTPPQMLVPSAAGMQKTVR